MSPPFPPGSPCEKIVTFFLHSATFRAKPAESRNTWVLNTALALGFGRFEGFVATATTLSCLGHIVARDPKCARKIRMCAQVNRYQPSHLQSVLASLDQLKLVIPAPALAATAAK